mgnify:CR=1 FL=1
MTASKLERRDYPFSAIVGQPELKAALLIGLIDPSIGGVLLRGTKGTAKTTSVRALGRIIGQAENMGQLVEVPLNTTEDRLVGSLELERALSEGQRSFASGLLAKADNGLLYVDEVNLLDDHLVDVLLDVAASGVNVVEREGISESHFARFLLIGTMNPEEGELRPQFLDRFGLCVPIETVSSVEERKLIVKRHLQFQSAPDLFRDEWQEDEKQLLQQIVRARKSLQKVAIPDDVVEFSVQLAVESGASGHRAEVVLTKTARAVAAMTECEKVTKEQVMDIAPLVLLHRVACSPVESDEARKRLVLEALSRAGGATTTGPALTAAVEETDHWEREWGVGHEEVESMQVPGNQAAGSTLISFLKKKLKKHS